MRYAGGKHLRAADLGFFFLFFFATLRRRKNERLVVKAGSGSADFIKGQFTKIINCITLDNPASTVFTSEEIVPIKKNLMTTLAVDYPEGFVISVNISLNMQLFRD